MLLPGNEKNAAAPSGGISVEIEQFLRAVAQSPVSVLLLDYDGTLAPFRLDRRLAFPYPGMTAVLQQIMLTGRTRLAIVTGRNAYEVIALLTLHPHPEIWGSHGLERLRPDGTYVGPREEAPVLQALADADRWLKHQGLHDRAEPKTGAIAVHWRGMDEAKAAETRSRVLSGWAPIAQSVRMQLLEFDGGIEMRMPDRDKGDAVRVILEETGLGVPIAYLGDDLTDEHAFVALGASGLTVLVRPEWRTTAAAHWIKPPEELMDFLARWLRACRG